ncbi:MAG TPA: formylglycine-generating enzyme family protein [Gemmatimonadales bacterium]|nr:formylglycine-generating enzyme family protein [Gemmatimonadales bacterium]
MRLALAAGLAGLACTTALAACRKPSTRDLVSSAAASGVPAVAASTAVPHVDTTPPPGPAPEGMAWVPGGVFWMGCGDCNLPDAVPLHLVRLTGYWIDRHPVTNAEFARFVKATGYVTVAERAPRLEDYPGVPREQLVAGSAVFSPPSHTSPTMHYTDWWRFVPGANWRHPAGPGSDLNGRENHPVVHIAYEDAVAYAAWAGKRLPTEAEYEFAARGGLDRKKYAWGDELRPGGKWAANIYQGSFPVKNTGQDGYVGTSPVEAFPPNGFGLYDMGGNVWQWTSDWYRPDTYAKLAKAGAPVENPRGPDAGYDPAQPKVPKRVIRGGSYLCTDQYCTRYLVGSRGKGEPTSGASNLGFRLVRSAP